MKVYFDIDGVLNLSDQDIEMLRTTSPWGASSWKELLVVDTYPVLYTNDVMDAIRELDATPGVECVWATTWKSRAAGIFGREVGVGENWRFLEELPTSEGIWWKEAAVLLDMKNSEDVHIWFDDELTRNAVRETSGANLFIETDPTIGIQPSHFELLHNLL